MEELFEAGVGEEDPFDDYRNILYPSAIADLSEEDKIDGKQQLGPPRPGSQDQSLRPNLSTVEC